jgi:TRAP-type C4-dicarboxylate transport system permease small subunit
MKRIQKIYTTLFFLAFTAVTVNNPAKGFFSVKFGTDFKTILESILDLIVSFSGIIALLFIIIGGYQYMTSAANPKLAESGKKTLTNAIIGLAIIVLSYVIIRIVIKTLGGS